MKEKYDLFGMLTIVGAALILIVGVIIVIQKSSGLGETLAMLGIWVIVSFLVMVGVEGNARGIPRHKVKVPWKLAIMVFSLAGLLFAVSGIIGIT